MSKIEVYLCVNIGSQDWRWRLKSRNGEIVSSGEGYVTRAGAVRGAKAMQRAAATARWVIDPIL